MNKLIINTIVPPSKLKVRLSQSIRSGEKILMMTPAPMVSLLMSAKYLARCLYRSGCIFFCSVTQPRMLVKPFAIGALAGLSAGRVAGSDLKAKGCL